MKSTLKILSALFLGLILFASCSKDDDPADNDFFVGTYNGSVSYTNGDVSKSNTNGKVTVSKVGDSYSFYFSDDIPDIKGVKFEQSGDNTYISIGSGVTGITINQSSLKMYVSNDNGTWTADCKR